MAGELRDIIAWIITTLMADATLTTTYGLTNVWMTEAPEESGYPYIVIQKQTGGHRFLLNNVHAMTDDWLLIKCVDESGQSAPDGGDRARRVASRVAQLLEGQTPSISGGTMYLIRRQNDYDYVTAEAGKKFWQVGSVYQTKYV